MIIEILNLTSIIGHHTVPVGSFDTVDEYVLDDNINYKSETLENKDLLSKHSAGIK